MMRILSMTKVIDKSIEVLTASTEYTETSNDRKIPGNHRWFVRRKYQSSALVQFQALLCINIIHSLSLYIHLLSSYFKLGISGNTTLPNWNLLALNWPLFGLPFVFAP